jgi:hypothetical protein
VFSTSYGSFGHGYRTEFWHMARKKLGAKRKIDSVRD